MINGRYIVGWNDTLCWMGPLKGRFGGQTPNKGMQLNIAAATWLMKMRILVNSPERFRLLQDHFGHCYYFVIHIFHIITVNLTKAAVSSDIDMTDKTFVAKM